MELLSCKLQVLRPVGGLYLVVIGLNSAICEQNYGSMVFIYVSINPLKSVSI